VKEETREFLIHNLKYNPNGREKGLRAIGACSRCNERTVITEEGLKQFEGSSYPFYLECDCGGRLRVYDRVITCEYCNYEWLPNVREPKLCHRCRRRRDWPPKKEEWNRKE